MRTRTCVGGSWSSCRDQHFWQDVRSGFRIGRGFSTNRTSIVCPQYLVHSGFEFQEGFFDVFDLALKRSYPNGLGHHVVRQDDGQLVLYPGLFYMYSRSPPAGPESRMTSPPVWRAPRPTAMSGGSPPATTWCHGHGPPLCHRRVVTMTMTVSWPRLPATRTAGS